LRKLARVKRSRTPEPDEDRRMRVAAMVLACRQRAAVSLLGGELS